MEGEVQELLTLCEKGEAVGCGLYLFTIFDGEDHFTFDSHYICRCLCKNSVIKTYIVSYLSQHFLRTKFC